jgi:hypothetical protein
MYSANWSLVGMVDAGLYMDCSSVGAKCGFVCRFVVYSFFTGRYRRVVEKAYR